MILLFVVMKFTKGFGIMLINLIVMNITIFRLMLVFMGIWFILSIIAIIATIRAMIKAHYTSSQLIFWIFLVFITCSVAIPFIPVNQINSENHD